MTKMSKYSTLLLTNNKMITKSIHAFRYKEKSSGTTQNNYSHSVGCNAEKSPASIGIIPTMRTNLFFVTLRAAHLCKARFRPKPLCRNSPPLIEEH